MGVNNKTGVMEEETSVGKVINKLAEIVKNGGELRATLVPKSKHHNSKPMIVVSEKPPMLRLRDNTGVVVGHVEDVTIWHIEVSEEGIFAYIFDDGVS